MTETVVKPIPMMLHCPACGFQHVDAESDGWKNPPHRSHLCSRCNCIWRPADVATVGVTAIVTRGLSDNWGGNSTRPAFKSDAPVEQLAVAIINDAGLLRLELAKGHAVHGVIVMPGGVLTRACRLLEYMIAAASRIIHPPTAYPVPAAWPPPLCSCGLEPPSSCAVHGGADAS